MSRRERDDDPHQPDRRETRIHYAEGRRPVVHLGGFRLARAAAGGGRAAEWTLASDRVRIGASSDNDIVVDDHTVSGHHCEIIRDAAGFLVIDRDSMNGTSVNRVRVREAYLTSGAVLRLGRIELRFSTADETVEIAPAPIDRLGELVGAHPRMRELYALIDKLAPTGATVVILGESGTGKEATARTLHACSRRAAGPFVVFDCSAVAPSLIESELFGHERGAFTGAGELRRGLVEAAQGGTLFLDEIGELAPELQPKLLRLLERFEFRRVGSHAPMRADIRVVAATSRDLEQLVRAGGFRPDLFYRLSVARLFLPPLRERIEDLGLLVEHLLATRDFTGRPDAPPVQTLSELAWAHLYGHHWPGNVRELANVLQHACSLSHGPILDVDHLPWEVRGAAASGPHAAVPVASGLKDAREVVVSSFERTYLADLLARHDGNLSRAAREAGLARKNLRELLRKHGLAARRAPDGAE